MKTLKILVLTAVVALTANALAQTGGSQAESTDRNDVAVARRAYAPIADSERDKDPKSNSIMAQRLDPRLRRVQMYTGGYPRPWMGSDDGHSVAIGGLIGFGAGAALGAGVHSDARGKFAGALLVGSLGALFGASIGHAVSIFQVHRPYRGPWPDDDEEMASRQQTIKPSRGGLPSTTHSKAASTHNPTQQIVLANGTRPGRQEGAENAENRAGDTP
jgi:hypothetical protein